MSSTFLARRSALTIGTALALVLLAGSVSAQCLINGPTTMCAGTVQLCGDPGPYEYEWTGPNGFMANTECIDVAVPGIYSLRIFDYNNALWFGPCTHTVTSGAGPACSITGPTSGCDGTPVQLCGPAGNLTYEWTGPNGFSGSTMCVSVSQSGTYQLVVRDAGTGCASAPASQTVTFDPCRTLLDNCPRTASFWARQCSPHNPARFPFDAGQVAAIAACADDRSAAFNWAAGAGSFCRTVRWFPPCNVRMRAKRQFSAVLANMCAGSLGLTPHVGPGVSLDPSTALDLGDLSTTVGEWAANADARLVDLEHRSLNDRQVRNAYRDIIRVAWHINHGLGIGPVCTPQLTATIEPTSGAASDDDDALDPDDMSLILATADDAAPSLVFERPSPNPFSNSARIAYTISDAGDQDVVIVIHDLTGRAVRELVHTQQAPGRYEVQWDGRATDGSLARNGVYFVSGRVGGQPVQARLTLLR